MKTALVALDVIGGMNQINMDLHSIAKEYNLSENEEPSFETMKRILKRKDFKTTVKELNIEQLVENYPFPIIAMTKEGEYVCILDARKQTEELLIYHPHSKQSVPISYQQFKENFKPQCMVVKYKKFAVKSHFGFGWFLAQVVKYKTIMLEVFLASFVTQILALSLPIFIQVIIDKVLSHQSISTLDIIAIAYFGVIVFDFLLDMVRNYILSHTVAKIDVTLGAKLYTHLLSLPYIYFSSKKVGNIITRVMEMNKIRSFISDKSINVLLDVIFSVIFVIVMFIYSVKLTLISLGFVTIIGLIYFIFTPNFRKKLEEQFKMGSQSHSFLVESISGIETVKSLSLEHTMNREWEQKLANYVQSNFHLNIVGFNLAKISEFLKSLMELTTLYFGVLLVLDTTLTIGELIAFRMFSARFITPILNLSNLWNDFQEVLLSVDRLGDILNTPKETSTKQMLVLNNLQGDIVLKNVKFSYKQNSEPIINNINLTIKENSTIGIVGRSGSGKSTITKLLQKLYLVNEGSISINNIDIRNFDMRWYRNQIGVVLQESYLFSGTIRDNITIARPNASMEMIIDVAKTSGVDEFVSSLPEGYNTIVEERGTSLSGGQKQRIAIARALLMNPKVLIFDEATSALDYESEKIINSNIQKIQEGKTMIIIAHRLSTVKNCDTIIVMDKGSIVESGSHDELLQKQGYYHHLYKQQER